MRKLLLLLFVLLVGVVAHAQNQNPMFGAQNHRTPTAFVTSVNSVGSLRNNLTGYVGFRITTGASAPTITALGAYRDSGNTHTHTLYLYKRDGVGNLTLKASVSIDLSSGTANQYKYANLSSPVTLEANTSYAIYLAVVNGEDSWHDVTGTSLSHTSVATLSYADYSTDGVTAHGIAGDSYGPVDFKFIP